MTRRPGGPAPGDGVLIRPSGDKHAPAPGAGRFGMALFLASLGVLFLASLVAFWVVRLRAETWPPPGAPRLPAMLWLSTAVLVAESAAIQAALAAIRHGDQRALGRRLLVALALAALFLGCQSWAWVRFFHGATFFSHLYGFTFYVLTGLHALHVMGGIVALAVTMVRAALGKYSWVHYPGVAHAAAYWHFLGAVWLALFASLLLAA